MTVYRVEVYNKAQNTWETEYAVNDERTARALYEQACKYHPEEAVRLIHVLEEKE